MRRAILVGTVAAVAAASVVLAPPASATFHLIKISEILGGSPGEPNAQFIELQMYSGSQNQLATHSVVVYDASGIEKARFTFTANVPNGADQAHVLVATPEAEAAFGVKADLPMTPAITPAGGKVCWEPQLMIDCASWGNYSAGATDQGGNATGTPFNQTAGLVPGQSMTRKISGGSDPNKLDAQDDTNDSSKDFVLAASSPEANAPAGGASGPAVERHDRSISLRLAGHLDASGRVTVNDGFSSCRSKVPAIIQKKAAGKRWKTIDRFRTAQSGRYERPLPDSAGTFRAKALAFSPTENDDCAAATSKPRRS